ncbi:hypothetical protein [Pelomonas sp. Root1444]|uniref:hypothetical protein n=1 Tax=Pelomonas sp. Root1444 TaxID=1736464 RepID=UPI000703AC00|nr:hypothetical protein [Pelomonas sp. Root1444]KQY88273.1 hypothetical protein ASD35_11830 [Pelomonas sp. Root1444]
MKLTGVLERLPRWFAEQAHAVEERARLQRESAARRQEMEFICAVEVKDSGWDEWEDTVAAFNAR